MKWNDDRWGAKGRGIYILLSSPVLLYALYIIMAVGYESPELLVKYLAVGMFLLFTYQFVSVGHCILVCLKTLQRAELLADQWDVVLYFGKQLRFGRDEVSSVEIFEKKSPKIWASPLSIDKTKPNYVVRLVTGEVFYITGVLPEISGLVEALRRT